MVAGHPLDVSESLLGGGDQLRAALLQSPLVLVLLIKPEEKVLKVGMIRRKRLLPFIVTEFLFTKPSC